MTGVKKTSWINDSEKLNSMKSIHELDIAQINSMWGGKPILVFSLQFLPHQIEQKLLCGERYVEGELPICNDTKQTIDELPWTNIDIRQYASNMIILFDNNMASNTFPSPHIVVN